MKKILLSASMALLFCAFAQAQYFVEDFESGVPMGWTVEGQWELTDAAGISSAAFQPGAHTTFMGFNDDGLGQTVIASGRITTGAIDLTMVNGMAALYFESYFINGDYQGADETAKVFMSTDAGANWTELVNLSISGNSWEEAGVFLPDVAGQTIWLAFEYDDGAGWNYGWCIDDIRIDEPTVLRDVSFEALNREAMLGTGIPGASIYPGGAIRNNGVMPLTSIDLTWNDGTNSGTETVSGFNLGYRETILIKANDPATLPEGTTSYSVSLGNANGMGDDENTANDDGGSFSVTTVDGIHPDRGVIVEEATGTWCQWCPRGAVFMEVMSSRYPGHFVGVAVHNGDPMVLGAYDNGVGNFPGFSGYPSVIFNRENILNPSAIESPFLAKAAIAPVATLNLGAEFDETTRDLTVSIDAQFLEDIPNGYRFNAIIIEDGVTGTDAGYNQINAYGGGGAGVMGGFEVLGGSVPASQMVYDLVGRALLGGFNGKFGSVPTDVLAGETHGYVFDTYNIPADYDLEHIHIVGVLYDENGEVANAMNSTIDEAVANGLYSSSDEVFNHEIISVYPNPFSTVTNVQLNLEKSADVTMFVYNSTGQLVAQRDYGQLSGSQILPFDGSNLNEGVYQLHIKVGDELATQRVFLTK